MLTVIILTNYIDRRIVVVLGFKYIKMVKTHMDESVSDSFYENNSVIHRVGSVSYSQDGESVRTFCSKEFDLKSEDDAFSVPISLVDRTEICVECERNHSHIRYDRFNFDDSKNQSEYKFFIKADVRVGEKRGFTVQETVEADSIDEAKSSLEQDYEMAELYKYYYISRSRSYGEWEVLVDERVRSS